MGRAITRSFRRYSRSGTIWHVIKFWDEANNGLKKVTFCLFTTCEIDYLFRVVAPWLEGLQTFMRNGWYWLRNQRKSSFTTVSVGIIFPRICSFAAVNELWLFKPLYSSHICIVISRGRFFLHKILPTANTSHCDDYSVWIQFAWACPVKKVMQDERLCKAKRQYLLTCKVSDYCLLALQCRAVLLKWPIVSQYLHTWQCIHRKLSVQL